MDLQHPDVAILMATYNGEAFIEEQLNSLFAQTYRHFYLIVCDDASTDSTIDILHTYKNRHSNMTVYQNTTNIGYVKNFEKLLQLAESYPYIVLCDQDDIWQPNKLQIQHTLMSKLEKKYINTPLLLHSDLLIMDDKKQIQKESYFTFRSYRLRQAKDLGHILGPCGVMGNTLFFNKPLRDLILPFPEKLENHDYWIAVVNELLGKRITLREPLVKYRIHDENASNSIDKIERKRFSLGQNLPYENSTRGEVIEALLTRYHLPPDDKKILESFLVYLNRNASIFQRGFVALRYSFIKRSIWYRIKFIIKCLRKK